MIPQQTTMPDRRFPPPWTAEETETCFIVKGRGGRRYVEGLGAGHPTRAGPATSQAGNEIFVQEQNAPLIAWMKAFNKNAPIYVPGTRL